MIFCLIKNISKNVFNKFLYSALNDDRVDSNAVMQILIIVLNGAVTMLYIYSALKRPKPSLSVEQNNIP